MSRPAFVDWLASQTGRDDPVGDIARDVAQDIRDGAVLRTAGAVRRRMNDLGAIPDAYAAFDRSVTEWRTRR